MEPALAGLRDAAAGIVLRPGRVPVLSNVTGEVAGGDFGSPGYWARHARQAVRFADAVGSAVAAGGRRFLVLGPDGGLAGLIAGCLDAGPAAGLEAGAVTIGAGLRKDRPEAASVLSAVAALSVAGAEVDWRSASGTAGGRLADLPTYPFQHQRYWLQPPAGAADVSAAGLQEAGHPLLGAVVALPGSDGLMLTGRLSLKAQPWLAGDAVFGRVVVPATLFADLLLTAAGRLGCAEVGEMTLEAPLVMPAAGGVDVSVVIPATGATAEPGGRAASVYSRPAGAGEAEWVLHARGTLGAAEGDGDPPAAEGLRQWPPAGAQPADPGARYAQLADRGYGYGPAFRVRALWRRDGEVLAEVAVPPDAGVDVAGFGIHPALLDAALHAALLADPGDGEAVALPFAWEGVRLHMPRGPRCEGGRHPGRAGRGVGGGN